MDCRMKILIEYDGSRRADNAIEDLQNAGLPREAKAKIVSVIEPIIPVGTSEVAWGMACAQVTEQEILLSRLAVKRACERLSKLFPDWELDEAVHPGNKELELIAMASRWKPDLVIISPLKRNELGRLIFGSLSRSIVERTSCSVRVARPAEINDGADLRLLIGWDGSPASAEVVREVTSRRWPKRAQARLVNCFKSSFVLGSESYDVDEPLLRMRLSMAVEMLRTAGLVVSLVVREGPPRQVILDEGARYGARCIFLSADDRGGFRELLFGTTAAAVATKAQCTVEVVREKAKPQIATDVGLRWKTPEQSVLDAVTQVSVRDA
jgi:nucleotide-binding universal stress UspA family protein